MTDSAEQPYRSPSKTSLAFVWAAQILLTLIFAVAGTMQAFWPLGELARHVRWFPDITETAVRLIGAAELLAAAGLLFPSALRVKPGISILVAAALTMGMFIATSIHYVHGEYGLMLIPAMLAGLCGYVALMRLTVAQVRGKY